MHCTNENCDTTFFKLNLANSWDLVRGDARDAYAPTKILLWVQCSTSQRNYQSLKASRGCLKKKWTDILISAAKTTIPRPKLHFRWSKLFFQRINLRYYTPLWLKKFQRYDRNYEKVIFQENMFL